MDRRMTQNSGEIYEQICTLITPFNAKKITIGRDTTFSVDLEFDSLTVMDILAEIEDEFDITIPLNMLPDLETVGQFADAVHKLMDGQ